MISACAARNCSIVLKCASITLSGSSIDIGLGHASESSGSSTRSPMSSSSSDVWASSSSSALGRLLCRDGRLGVVARAPRRGRRGPPARWPGRRGAVPAEPSRRLPATAARSTHRERGGAVLAVRRAPADGGGDIVTEPQHRPAARQRDAQRLAAAPPPTACRSRSASSRVRRAGRPRRPARRGRAAGRQGGSAASSPSGAACPRGWRRTPDPQHVLDEGAQIAARPALDEDAVAGGMAGLDRATELDRARPVPTSSSRIASGSSG